MMGILGAKLKLLIRKPGTFLGMTGMTLIFAFVIGLGDTGSVQIPVYTVDDEIRDSIVGETLDASESYVFKWMSEEDVNKNIADGNVEVGVELASDGFRLLIGVQSGFVELVEQIVEEAYMTHEQITRLTEAATEKGLEISSTDIETAVSHPPFHLEKQNFKLDDAKPYNHTYHALFGFTLFFVIYTIGSHVLQILTEKDMGIWDRLILSPVKKWQMYVSNFIYSFMIGYFQVMVVFTIFRFVIGIDFGGQFGMAALLILPYIFAIVALCILLTGLVKTAQQFNAVISIVTLSIAMIGGLFWPLDVVESKVMLMLSKFVPTTYGAEIMKDIAVYGVSPSELIQPISVLLLMGVFMAGIGIHLMERRHI